MDIILQAVPKLRKDYQPLMKLSYRFVLAIIVLLAFVASIAPPAAAGGASITITVESAFLHSDPSFSARRVASVFKGQVLPVVARTADNQWAQVGPSRVAGEGWISVTLGKVEGNLDLLPTGPATPAPEAAATAQGLNTDNAAVYGELGAYPVVPVVSARAREIYQSGLSQGSDPKHFSKIGDCQSVPVFFLSMFDSPGQYRLGREYAYLQEAIAYYGGSFSRKSETVRNGFNIASALSPLWADPKTCRKGETPLQCEFRLHKPSIVIISMETWWSGDPSNYEDNLRQVVEFSISHGALPIVATKADNLEGNGAINAGIVRVAKEYDIPLWNFWLAVQPLPGHGLAEDAFHLTFGRPFFDDENAMQTGWAVRNLTALQALDAVWRGVK